jgi:hypothetical protein
MLLLPLVAWVFRTRGGVELPARLRRTTLPAAGPDIVVES